MNDRPSYLHFDIAAYWRLKTESIAQTSAAIIYRQFLNYLKADDFVGADMARKYLQMGYARARRCANYKGRKKYDAEGNYALLKRGTGDPEKQQLPVCFINTGKWPKPNPGEQQRKMSGSINGVCLQSNACYLADVNTIIL